MRGVDGGNDLIILEMISKGCSMITSRGLSIIDNVIVIIGLALMIGGTYLLFSRTEKKRMETCVVIFSIIVGVLLMWAGINMTVLRYVGRWIS